MIKKKAMLLCLLGGVGYKYGNQWDNPKVIIIDLKTIRPSLYTLFKGKQIGWFLVLVFTPLFHENSLFSNMQKNIAGREGEAPVKSC